MITIRRAIPDDANAMNRVSKETWIKTYPNKKLGITVKDITQKFKLDKTRVKRWQASLRKDKTRKAWVAEDNKIIGFCSVLKENNVKKIGAIYILPKYQGQGIGKKLFMKAVKWLGKEPISVEVVSYNENAIAFYRSLGFVKKNKIKPYKLPSGKLMPEIRMLRK